MILRKIVCIASDGDSLVCFCWEIMFPYREEVLSCYDIFQIHCSISTCCHKINATLTKVVSHGL